MFPTYTANDVTDDALRDFVPRSNFALSYAILSQLQNRFDLRIGELCVAMLLPNRHPAFLHRVIQIVLGCADKQMGRIAAWPMVAVVTNVQAFWNWSVSQFIRYAVRSRETTVVKSKHAIDVLLGSFPRPAFVWFTDLNLAPKSIFHWKATNSAPTGFGANHSGACIGFFGPLWHG